MPTLNDISVSVDIAKAYSLKKIALELVKFQDGGCGDLSKLDTLKRIIRALTFQINSNVNDDSTQSLYECLLTAIAGFTGTYTRDPEVQIPGQTVITVMQVVGYNINKYPFATHDDTPTVIFDNYQSLYYPLYGNNPVLAMYIKTPDYSGEEQTPPIITFVIPGDDTSGIDSIRYEFAVGTTGEFQMSGKAPGSGSTGVIPPGGGGVVTIPLTFTQANLQNAGTIDEPNWYLPLMLPAGKIVLQVSINNVVYSQPYIDLTSNPIRVFDFSNNDAQTIKVTII